MAASKHLFRYSPAAAIQTDRKIRDIKDGFDPIKVLTVDELIPKNAPFMITIDLPNYKSANLIPRTTNGDLEPSVLAVVSVFDMAAKDVEDGKFTNKTKIVQGTPLNTPQRKSKFKHKVKHQTFQFPAGNFAGTPVTIVVRSLHHFFEEDAGDPTKVVTYDGRRSVVKLKEVKIKA
jgi:hypothetical protein